MVYCSPVNEGRYGQDKSEADDSAKGLEERIEDYKERKKTEKQFCLIDARNYRAYAQTGSRGQDWSPIMQSSTIIEESDYLNPTG